MLVILIHVINVYKERKKEKKIYINIQKSKRARKSDRRRDSTVTVPKITDG